MGLSVVAKFDTLRRVAAGAGTLDGTWRPVFQMTNAGVVTAVADLAHKPRLIKAYNNTDDDVWVSFDLGVTAHDVIPANGAQWVDITAGRADSGGDFFLPIGNAIYVRTADGAAATGLYLYFTIIYGLGE